MDGINIVLALVFFGIPLIIVVMMLKKPKPTVHKNADVHKETWATKPKDLPKPIPVHWAKRMILDEKTSETKIERDASFEDLKLEKDDE